MLSRIWPQSKHRKGRGSHLFSRPLNLLPLFQQPEPLLPAYTDALVYGPGEFPQAEAVHATILKLPVWHRDLSWLIRLVPEVVRV